MQEQCTQHMVALSSPPQSNHVLCALLNSRFVRQNASLVMSWARYYVASAFLHLRTV